MANNIDCLNYIAIDLLEQLGNFTPSQVHIDLAESLLMNIATLMIAALYYLPRHGCQTTHEMEVETECG